MYIPISNILDYFKCSTTLILNWHPTLRLLRWQQDYINIQRNSLFFILKAKSVNRENLFGRSLSTIF